MARRNSASKSKSDNVTMSLLGRVYRVLPFVLIAGMVFNLWFLYNFVNRERVTIDSQRDYVISHATNAYHFVMHSLSNEIRRVQFSNDMRLRPFVASSSSISFASSSTNAPSSLVSPSPSHSPLSSVDSVLPVDVEGSFSIVNGLPCLSVDGSHYFVGDDFGLGEISQITRYFVFCGGRFFRVRRPVPFSPSPSPLPVKLQNDKEV